ncbi:MAG: arginine--tRNA ligase [Elusimicrobia bacterium]|jgi:arginyl-tRNA synthetase|nr:arginine--tRNA ligase [Elusimicrobiota bacterium]
MKETVRRVLAEAAKRWAAGQNPPLPMGEALVEVPPANIPGDFASNWPLVLAPSVRKSPRQVAQEIVSHVATGSVLEKVEVAGPGFLNFTMSVGWLTEELRHLLLKRSDYGRQGIRAGERVLIEFVSANPNGPLHVGHGRGAALGDSLARIYRHLGYDVTTEYYVNNVGNQMENLGASIMWRADVLDLSYLTEQEKVDYSKKNPDDLYKGDYLVDVARDVMRRFPKGSERPQGIVFFRDEGLALILDGIRSDLAAFGVAHDTWYPESRLFEEGRVDAALAELRNRGDLKEEDGALWFLSSKYGDDKDRVLKRQDERLTYFASDIAYHHEKFGRGFTRLIDIWGTDHHGYVSRVKAATQALGHDPARLTILLYQLVSLVRGGKPVAMSTRTGEFVKLTEVVNEVGKDAARFFFALRGPNSQLEFDLDLAKRQASDNPVFYVKYVHARCCSLFREAEKRGVRSVETEATVFTTPAVLHPTERALLIRLATFPDVLDQCARDLTPHHVTDYLLKLAGDFHRFYENCPVLNASDDQGPFRLALVDGVRMTIRNGLSLLGVDAPEEM